MTGTSMVAKTLTAPAASKTTIGLLCSILLAFSASRTVHSAKEFGTGPITCGSVIKIAQADSGYYLNSEEKNLNAGSGQQLTTFVKDPATHNTLWWVRPAHSSTSDRTHRHKNSSGNDEKSKTDPEYGEGANCQLAEPVLCGSAVRLTHLETLKNLHSHSVASVLSQQQEITSFGQGDGKGDAGDNWIVHCVGSKAKTWQRGTSFRLQHQDTGKYLGASADIEFNQKTCGQSCPIMGHLEAFGRSSADSYSLLRVEQGVHLSH